MSLDGVTDDADDSVMARSSFCLLIVLMLLAGCGDSGREQVKATTSGSQLVSDAALRICVDRWNQDNMVGWASMSLRVSIRGLNARERSVLVESHPEQRVCTVSLAPRSGDNSWICQMNDKGGYECPLVTSDGMPPLTNPNGRTDRRGILTLITPLAGTHATPPLSWQRRYPHVDAFILPWTRAGTLRPGLRFTETEHGSCDSGPEHVVPNSAIRCVDLRYGQFDPCFAKRRNFRVGDIVACGGAGNTTFIRWLITRNP